MISFLNLENDFIKRVESIDIYLHLNDDYCAVQV